MNVGDIKTGNCDRYLKVGLIYWYCTEVISFSRVGKALYEIYRLRLFSSRADWEGSMTWPCRL
jgi:hypothetical protein